MAPVKLYLVRLSPTCRIVWLYLLQNKIEHELIDIEDVDDLINDKHLEDLDGHSEVPILVDGDVTVFEAPAILDYLAKTYTNNAGFGKSMREQIKCSSLISWINSEIHRVSGYMFAYPQFLNKYHLETDEANEELVESGIQQLTNHISKIESKYLAKHAYLCGDAMTLADSFLVTTIMQAQWADFNFSLWPKLRTWYTKVIDQPYWGEVHETHIRFVKELHQQES